MALIENGLVKAGAGVVAGIGVLIAAPIVVPMVSAFGRPILRGFVSGGSALYQKGRQAVADGLGAWEELVAEARAELEAGRKGSATPPEQAPKKGEEAQMDKRATAENDSAPEAHKEEECRVHRFGFQP